MSVTGWKYPGTTANVAFSGTDWSNHAYVKADDTNYASVIVDGKTGSNLLTCTNYGFSSDILSGATINGIEAIICKYASASGKAGDGRFSITKDASIYVGNDLASVSNWPTGSPSEITYGDATNLWGSTLTQSEIVATTFGVMLYINPVTFTAYVDYIKIRVYYTAGAAGGGIRNPFSKPFFGALGGPF